MGLVASAPLHPTLPLRHLTHFGRAGSGPSKRCGLMDYPPLTSAPFTPVSVPAYQTHCSVPFWCHWKDPLHTYIIPVTGSLNIWHPHHWRPPRQGLWCLAQHWTSALNFQHVRTGTITLFFPAWANLPHGMAGPIPSLLLCTLHYYPHFSPPHFLSPCWFETTCSCGGESWLTDFLLQLRFTHRARLRYSTCLSWSTDLSCRVFVQKINFEHLLFPSPACCTHTLAFKPVPFSRWLSWWSAALSSILHGDGPGCRLQFVYTLFQGWTRSSSHCLILSLFAFYVLTRKDYNYSKYPWFFVISLMVISLWSKENIYCVFLTLAGILFRHNPCWLFWAFSVSHFTYPCRIP